MKVVVYTSITGDYEKPRSDVLVIEPPRPFSKPVMNAKIPKILPHKFLNCDVSMWVDGNVFLNGDPEKIALNLLGDNDIALSRHQGWDCIYTEAARCQERFSDDPPLVGQIEKQKLKYLGIHWPVHGGLYDCSVLVRRNTDEVQCFNEMWWSEICVTSQRDQISFPVVLSQFPILSQYPALKFGIVEPQTRKNPLFKYTKHGEKSGRS